MVEIGTFHGCSTIWILQALRGTGTGHLYSYDIVDRVVRGVPEHCPSDSADFLFSTPLTSPSGRTHPESTTA